jgi:hypothetical protein
VKENEIDRMPLDELKKMAKALHIEMAECKT